jgi:hypothetical protein
MVLLSLVLRFPAAPASACTCGTFIGGAESVRNQVEGATAIVLGRVDSEPEWAQDYARVAITTELIFKGPIGERFYVTERGFSSCSYGFGASHHIMLLSEHRGQYHVNQCTAFRVEYDAQTGRIITAVPQMDAYVSLLSEIAPPKPPPDADAGLPVPPAMLFTIGVVVMGGGLLGWQVFNALRRDLRSGT